MTIYSVTFGSGIYEDYIDIASPYYFTSIEEAEEFAVRAIVEECNGEVIPEFCKGAGMLSNDSDLFWSVYYPDGYGGYDETSNFEIHELKEYKEDKHAQF
jgi:hypothetical protein